MAVFTKWGHQAAISSEFYSQPHRIRPTFWTLPLPSVEKMNRCSTLPIDQPARWCTLIIEGPPHLDWAEVAAPLGSATTSASPIQVILLHINRSTDIDWLIRFQLNILNNVLVKYCDTSYPLWKENIASFRNDSNVTGRFPSCRDMMPSTFSSAIILLYPPRNSDSSCLGSRCDIWYSLYKAVIAFLCPPIVDTALYLILSSLITLSATSISPSLSTLI